MRKSWLLTCLINFLIASLMGLLLRAVHLFPFQVNYQNFIHAHSHVAMLGWIYMMIFCFFVHYFVPDEKRKKYNILFWLTQFAVTGMMISFPIQGYAAFSITFSTLHIILSYVFCYWIWKDKVTASSEANKLLVAALFFLILSTLGAWSLGIVGNLYGKQSALYRSAIQFFLHFQFNGWFICAVLSVFFTILKQSEIYFRSNHFKLFYYLMVTAALFTLALPLSWNYPFPYLKYFNIAGSLLQAAALFIFIKMLRDNKFQATVSGTFIIVLLPLISIILRTFMQIAVSFPMLVASAHKIRNLTIGFIHLSTLGIITGFLFYFIIQTYASLRQNWCWRVGISLFVIGFILSEIILFSQGILTFSGSGQMDNYNLFIFIGTAFIPVGIIMIILSVILSDKAAPDMIKVIELK